jgi:hypothetical protein
MLKDMATLAHEEVRMSHEGALCCRLLFTTLAVAAVAMPLLLVTSLSLVISFQRRGWRGERISNTRTGKYTEMKSPNCYTEHFPHMDNVNRNVKVIIKSISTGA